MGAKGSKEDWLEGATGAFRPTWTAASFIQPPFGLHVAGIWELHGKSQTASLHLLGHMEHAIISVSWTGACNSHNQMEAWKKSQGFGISPGDRPAWGKLAEKQDKGISEHIEPYFSLFLECTDCQNRRYHLQKLYTARRFIGLERSLY